MATTYEFTVNINVDGKNYYVGDTVGESDLPSGCFISLKRQKQIVEHKEVPPDVVVQAPAPVEPPVEEEPDTHEHAHKSKKHK